MLQTPMDGATLHNSVARLIARLHRYSYSSTYLSDVLHRVSLASLIQFRTLMIVTGSQH